MIDMYTECCPIPPLSLMTNYLILIIDTFSHTGGLSDVVAVSYLVLLKTVSSSPSCENISDRSDIDISSSERSSPGSDEVNFRRGYRASACSLSLGAGGFSRDLTQVYNSVPVRIVSTDIARCLYKSKVSE